MARTKVVLNHRGMAQLLKSRGVRSHLTSLARPVLAAARADPHDETGDYESSLYIDQVTTDRAVVRVVAGDWKGHILEANYGILARALDAAGLKGDADPDELVPYTTLSGVTRMATRRQADAWMASRR